MQVEEIFEILEEEMKNVENDKSRDKKRNKKRLSSIFIKLM